MATQTPNIGLIKDDENEFYNVGRVNDNLDLIDQQVGNKVEKIDGKGLSTEDYTTEDKLKLAAIFQKAKLTEDTGIAIDISNTDLNNLVTTGFYRGANLINGPIPADGSWIFIEIIAHTQNLLLQKATIYTSTSKEKSYERIRNNGTWLSWYKISKQLTGSGAIPTTGWLTSGSGWKDYYCNVGLPGLVATDRVEIFISPLSMPKAEDISLGSTTTAKANEFTIYADAIPTETIPFEYVITRG